MRSKTIRKNAALAISLVAGLAGCHSARVAEPLTAEMASNEPDVQMEFWHALPDRRVTSNDEAFHALLLFVDGTDPNVDYPGRVEALKAKKMLPENFNGLADRAVQRGTIAVAIARILEIKGGLSMRLFGPSPRYAVRELQYMNLFPQSSPQQTFSGQELLGIIGRAEDYQRQFNENALAEGAPAGEATAPPRGPARGNDVPPSEPGSAPQQP